MFGTQAGRGAVLSRLRRAEAGPVRCPMCPPCACGPCVISVFNMADDGRAKRLKSSEDGVAEVVVDLRGRVAELESEIAKLRLENAQRIAALESENEQLRRGGRQVEGNHEALPVVVAAATVDLSRVDSSIVSHITSFLGTSRELLNLALTCKSFGWRQPLLLLNWSLIEEVTRQTVCTRATDAEMGRLPQYISGTTTWLSILHRYEHPLLFDVLLGGYIEHRNGDKTTVYAKDREYCNSVAVSSDYVMRSGTHYAEFLITGEPYIGIVRPMPGLDAGAYRGEFYFFDHPFYPDFLAQRTDDWGDSNVHACDFNCHDGGMTWTDWDGVNQQEVVDWDGAEGCETGDTVGMLLNLNEGTLTVYNNNRRLGVMKDGLSGPYCWCVSLFMKNAAIIDTVSIERGTLPNLDDDPIAHSYWRQLLCGSP